MSDAEPTDNAPHTELANTPAETNAGESSGEVPLSEQATQPAPTFSDNTTTTPVAQREGVPTWKTALLVALVAGLAGGMGGVVGGFIGGAAAVKISKPAKHGDERMMGSHGYGDREGEYRRGYGMPGIPGTPRQQGQPNIPPPGMGSSGQQAPGMGAPDQQGNPDYPTAPRGHESEREGSPTMPTQPQWNGQGGPQWEQGAPGTPGAPHQR